MMKLLLLYVDTEYCIVGNKFNTKISAQEPGTNVTINLILMKPFIVKFVIHCNSVPNVIVLKTHYEKT